MKILIISPSWIGDTMISHSLYRLLVIKYKLQIKIDVITTNWCAPIINRLIEVNDVFIAPYTHGKLELTKCHILGQLLKNKKYQQAIILPNSLKSALIPWLANIPIRTGWRGEMRYGFLNDIRVFNASLFPLMVQRYAALACDYNINQDTSNLPYPLPLPRLHIQKKEIISILHKFNLYKNQDTLIGLCPGSASNPAKCWPYYYYITLAIQLIHDGYHIVILGSHTEQFMNPVIEYSTLKKFKQHYHNLIGQTSLNEAIVILAACVGIVSNDSGLMHIASALKRPVVGLFGHLSNPNRTPPLYSNSKILCSSNIISNHHHTHQQLIRKKSINDNHYNLLNITPKQVFKTLQTLLQ